VPFSVPNVLARFVVSIVKAVPFKIKFEITVFEIKICLKKEISTMSILRFEISVFEINDLSDQLLCLIKNTIILFLNEKKSILEIKNASGQKRSVFLFHGHV